MNIWFISDTHNRHLELVVPKAEMVIHCGDESMQQNAALNELEARRFFDWFSSLDIPHKIYVPGNHSTAVERGLVRASDYPGVHFLIHESLTCGGLRLFGSPYTPRFHDWAYMMKRGRLDAAWQAIPEETDILITHGPPQGILDLARDSATKALIQVGCSALRRHVEDRVQPRIHAFGHLHDERGISNYGRFTRDATEFINCACCNLSGELKHHGFVIEI